MTKTRHPLVDSYLRDLRRAARVLPPAQRNELVADIESHIDTGLGRATSDASVTALLEDLGHARDIVAAATSPAPNASRRGKTGLALGLVAAGLSVLPVFGLFAAIPLGVAAITAGMRARRESRVTGVPDSAAVGAVIAGTVAILVAIVLTLSLGVFGSDWQLERSELTEVPSG